MHRPPDDTNQAYADMAIRALILEARLRGVSAGQRTTHAQLILDELDFRGHTTVRELARRHASQGYTYGGFLTAAHRLRKRGLLEKARPDGAIVRAGCCPCCGKEW